MNRGRYFAAHGRYCFSQTSLSTIPTCNLCRQLLRPDAAHHIVILKATEEQIPFSCGRFVADTVCGMNSGSLAINQRGPDDVAQTQTGPISKPTTTSIQYILGINVMDISITIMLKSAPESHRPLLFVSSLSDVPQPTKTRIVIHTPFVTRLYLGILSTGDEP
ncbi:hypothetical protein Hypma_000505 [Hypsizygus marmoreus]|uniref:Uncharacterized protein n=1 Tax=Hypsizygus marmoreus TaxID=39966 RepID=A0A369JH45_HYPMA|nr:hypothetical protein Hypma_000505 [Hypsizygus marmoreus]